jgi:hypothetical protein
MRASHDHPFRTMVVVRPIGTMTVLPSGVAGPCRAPWIAKEAHHV